MPPARAPNYDSPASMPSRATSAFHLTICIQLHEQASDYILWIAVHGGDADTVRTYLDSTRVFPSHFREWAQNLSRATVIASIPALTSLYPGLTNPALDPQVQPVPVPPLIATVVTLAIQHKLMVDSRQGRGRPLAGDRSLSGVYRPQDHVDLLSTNFGSSLTLPK